MNENIEVVTLEDGKDYMVTAELDINNIKYLFLTNEDDVADFCLRKINTINNNEYLVGFSFLTAYSTWTSNLFIFD